MRNLAVDGNSFARFDEHRLADAHAGDGNGFGLAVAQHGGGGRREIET